jgi:N-6 DNA Methylase
MKSIHSLKIAQVWSGSPDLPELFHESLATAVGGVGQDDKVLTGDSFELRKARGTFYTPVPVARFIADWAVRSPNDAVLEPSCGEAVFLHEAGWDGRHMGPLIGCREDAAGTS